MVSSGVYGGAFQVTGDLVHRFGEDRVMDTPISELGAAGVAVGAALAGSRPVLEFQFSDFATLAMEQIVNQAAKLRFMLGGKVSVPLVMRLPCGSGTGAAAQHSQSLEAWLAHVPGLKVVQPSTPHDAKGLLLAAIEDNDPVIFFEPKRIYNGPFDGHHERPVVPWSQHPAGEVPEGHYTVPLESARITRPGADVTVLAYGTMVWVSEAAAAESGVDAEVIDLRSLWPLDLDAIVASVKKTRRCVVVHEATRTCGFGAELVALVQEHCFYHLESPIERVTGWDTPYPHALEWHYFPGPARVAAALKRVMEN